MNEWLHTLRYGLLMIMGLLGLAEIMFSVRDTQGRISNLANQISATQNELNAIHNEMGEGR